jgi:hypothetical protein
MKHGLRMETAFRPSFLLPAGVPDYVAVAFAKAIISILSCSSNIDGI